MRWPFGPPHLTLKPSKTKQKKNKKTKNTKKNKKKNKKRNTHKNTKKELFSYQSIFSLFFGGCPKFPFLTPWPKKRAPKKHYKNRCFSKFFLKSSCASRNGQFWTKKTQTRNSSYHCFCLFLHFQQQKHKILLKPLFL